MCKPDQHHFVHAVVHAEKKASSWTLIFGDKAASSGELVVTWCQHCAQIGPRFWVGIDKDEGLKDP